MSIFSILLFFLVLGLVSFNCLENKTNRLGDHGFEATWKYLQFEAVRVHQTLEDSDLLSKLGLISHNGLLTAN
ncbi:hypothetical protein BpHYR1_038927 [Brachionus plicatilis]|uniref:Uncharacterized protein n=1 Tax=Brachionus plicatilis TaxID=10195 RepID=A0A3M7S023_BRAPC|nr:hypothetical protein BpHYR1_038927 [Brachionus plicatilis]